MVDQTSQMVDEIQEALDAPDVSHASLYRVLKGLGYPGGQTIIGMHRRGRCSCPE
jgi:hypothetical protein